MAYPATPKTWVAGDVLTAAQLNAELRDALLAAFPLGVDAWTTWAPVITQGATPTKTTNYAKYQRIGRTIIAHFNVTFTSAGTAVNDIVTTLPVTAASANGIGGSFRYFDVGVTNHAGTVVGATTTTAKFVYDGLGNNMGNGDFAIANTDLFTATIIYEAAT